MATVARPSRVRVRRAAPRHPIVRISTGGAAYADEPVALAPRRGRDAALVPAEPRRAIAPGTTIPRCEKGSPVVGSFSGSFRMRSSIGSMPSSAASSSIADSSPKVPTASPGARMKVFAVMFILTVSTSKKKASGRVDAFRRQDEGLRHVVVRSHSDYAGVDQGVEAAVGLGAKRHPLFGEGAATDDTEYAFAGEHNPYGAACQLRRRGCQHLVLPKSLLTKAAADKRRGDVHVLLVDPEHLRNGHASWATACEASWIRSVSPSQARVQACSLDRIVVVARRRVHDVDLMGRCGERGLGVLDLVLQRLPQENAGLRTISLSRGEGGYCASCS